MNQQSTIRSVPHTACTRISPFSVKRWTSHFFPTCPLRWDTWKHQCFQQPLRWAGTYSDTSWSDLQVQLINDAYNLVIDAILGPDSDSKDIKEPYSSILVTLKQVKIPIASVDVPLGMSNSLWNYPDSYRLIFYKHNILILILWFTLLLTVIYESYSMYSCRLFFCKHLSLVWWVKVSLPSRLGCWRGR